MGLLGFGLRVMTNWNARGKTLGSMRRRLEQAGTQLAQQYRAAPTSAANLERARHIIGIERWGQARLRTLLGVPAQHVEYDNYRPDEVDTMAALGDALAATRAETLALVDSLQAANKANATVRHNDLGELDVIHWLVYLNDHANRESMLIR